VAESVGVQRIVIVYDQDNVFTQNNLPLYEQAFATEGIEILATVPYSTGSPNFGDQLSQMRDSVADGIVLIALAEDAATIISQAREAGIPEDVRFIGTGSFSSPAFLEAGGDAVNGTLTGVAWNRNNNSGSNRRFVTRFTAEYGQPPDQLAAQAYTAVWVVANALRRADATDPALLRAELARTQFLESPLGLFSFDERGDADHAPVLQVAENGEFLVFQ
jgi:branched-chain amino acid transport system substrate-binding protein